MLLMPTKTLDRALGSIPPGDDWVVELDKDADNSGIFRVGRRVLQKRGHILVAICLNNGYYKRARIAKIIQVASGLSDEVTVFFTDGPAIHNYIALGRSEHYALKQVRKQRHQLKNACDAAISELDSAAARFSFVDWKEVYSRADYISTFSELTSLYDTNAKFQNDIRDATRSVLQRSRQQGDVERAVDIGIRYSLEELAFLLIYENIAAAKALPTSGDSDFAYIYHLRWEILEKLANGFYDHRMRNHVGFVVLSIISRHNTAF